MNVRRGYCSSKHVLYAKGLVSGREAFCRKTGVILSEAEWTVIQERVHTQWILLVCPGTLEPPDVRADFYVAQFRLRGTHGRLRGQSLPPGEGRAQIVFSNDDMFSRNAVWFWEDIKKRLPSAFATRAAIEENLPLAVDLWPEDR